MILGLLFITYLSAAEPQPSEVARQCFQVELDLYERVKGRLPTPDEADLIIDNCMGAYENARKKQETKNQKTRNFN